MSLSRCTVCELPVHDDGQIQGSLTVNHECDSASKSTNHLSQRQTLSNHLYANKVQTRLGRMHSDYEHIGRCHVATTGKSVLIDCAFASYFNGVTGVLPNRHKMTTSSIGERLLVSLTTNHEKIILAVGTMLANSYGLDVNI